MNRPIIKLHVAPADLEARLQDAKGNFRALLAAAPWLAELSKRGALIAKENASARVKYGKLKELTDAVGRVMAEHSACREGCSYCCHKPVAMSRQEAEMIAQRTGTQLTVGGSRRKPAENESVACPMLVDGRCSIHEFRPLVCRTNFNLSNDVLLCDPQRAPDDFQVPTLNMDGIWMAYATIFGRTDLGDIRDFLSPAGSQTK
ncbi:YkgJ family cysteine cluster protein [Herbaspirillum huttiense]|uniref:YkgJ family cysteine cluster protein n=1 Tax=Herbaspirillum huttiense TaxID=863372 RepID=UPI0039B07501